MTPNIHAIILHVSLEVRCIDRLYLQVVAREAVFQRAARPRTEPRSTTRWTSTCEKGLENLSYLRELGQ
jgi:hypothetical protein